MWKNGNFMLKVKTQIITTHRYQYLESQTDCRWSVFLLPKLVLEEFYQPLLLFELPKLVQLLPKLELEESYQLL